MHRFLSARRWSMMTVALSLLLGGAAAYSQEPQPPVRTAPAPKMDRAGAVIVPQGGVVRLQMRQKQPIETIESDRPAIVQVIADSTDPTKVVLLGRGLGTARITLKGGGVEETYEIVVQADIETLRGLIKRAAPTANVEVIPFGNNRVVLSGNVAHSEDIKTILELAAATFSSGNAGGGTASGSIVNAMTVGGVHQVQLDVTVASVSRTKARSRGFSFVLGGSTVNGGSLLGGLISNAGFTSQSVTGSYGVTSGATTTAIGTGGNLPFGIVPARFQGVIRALKDENVAKLLAETKLTTQSGRPAELLSGGQQPTIGPSSGITGPGVVYQPVGTSLKFTPLVYGNGKIYLEVTPSIKDVDFGRGLTLNGSTTPFLTEQSITASVVMEPGQTFALGGLLQTNRTMTSSRLPVLGEIPFLAPFFSTGTDMDLESELIILVTPHLVDALDCSQMPTRLPGQETRSPDDFEFFLETMLELPRGQRNVFEGKKYKAAWKNDPSAGTFPCGSSNCGGVAAGCTSCASCGTGAGCATGSCPNPVAAAAYVKAKPAIPVMANQVQAMPVSTTKAEQPGVSALPASLPSQLGNGGYEIQRTAPMPQEPASMPSSTIPPGARPSLPPLPTPR